MGGKKKPQEKCSEASKPANTTHVPAESKPESSQLNAAEGQTPIDPEGTRKANNEQMEKSAELLSKLALESKNLESSSKIEKPIQPKTSEHHEMEEKPRDQVMADRKAKKLAAQARKIEAAAQKKANKNDENQPSKGDKPDEKLKTPKTEETTNQASEIIKTVENKSRTKVMPEESSNKNISNEPINGAAKERGGILKFLQNYEVKENRVVPQDLDEAIQPQLSYLTENGTRALPLALGNLVKQLKKYINQLEPSISLHQAKEELKEWLLNFYKENIESPDQDISQATVKKLSNLSQCNILTYSWDPIVERIILDLVDQNGNIHVYIVDSSQQQGKKLLDSLCARKVPCTYGLMNSLGYFVSKCNTVLLGCSAILSNGHVVANRGSGLVALTAQAQNIPILVAAKTYKFVDKVRTFEKSSTYMSTTMMPEQLETIPDDLITALVTEMRFIPPSSAPAVLKVKQLANE
uniref:Translation initiation factor eIF2B subunit delta n=1 Tax=Acrobeloides nanus TaxID=290746 RepID=A0A914C7M0_9BILA